MIAIPYARPSGARWNARATLVQRVEVREALADVVLELERARGGVDAGAGVARSGALVRELEEVLEVRLGGGGGGGGEGELSH